MTNTKSVTSKAFVAIVAAAMLFSLVAPAAKAQTAEELQAQITALMAQIEALKAGMTTPAPVGGNCAAIPAPLTMNATGANVTALQNYLISAGQSIPAGATGFFGSQTRAAVAAWQSANGVTPPAGYYGPITAAAMAAKCVPSTVPTTPTTPTTPGAGSVTLSGEATLDSFDIDDADDTSIQEGDEEVEIGKFLVTFKNGDAEIDRLDVKLARTNTGGEVDPWDVFETISLWVDGDMIAESDASSKSDYLSRTNQTLRFSGLKLVAEEDETVEITVGATVRNSVRNLGTNDRWAVTAEGMRFFDAAGVADSAVSILPGTDSAQFTVDVAGEGEEVRLSLDSSNPSATDIIVEANDATNDVTILVGKFEARKGDMELNQVVVRVDTVGASTTKVVNSVDLVIDGKTFRSESIGLLSNGKSQLVTAAGEAIWYLFDIDGDIMLDADDAVKAEVVVDIRQQSGNYGSQQQIMAGINTAEKGFFLAEGAIDTLASSSIKGSAIGEKHTLVSEGTSLKMKSSSATADNNATTPSASKGNYSMTIEITAVKETMYVPLTAARGASTVAGAAYQIEDGSGVATSTGTATEVLNYRSGGRVSGNFVEISDGQTATFELLVSYNPATAGFYRVQLLSSAFNPTGAVIPDGTDVTTATPVEDFETSSININE